jgi:uncharacterized membrane protein YkvA (DUF1232 family)
MQNDNAPFEKLKQRTRLLKTQTFALYLAYQNPATPWYAKVFAGLVAAYAFSPIDLIPDFIPVLGYLDDLVLIPLGVTLALKMIPAEVMAECQTQAEARLEQGKPASRAAAIVIVLIWVLVAAFVIPRLGNIWWK